MLRINKKIEYGVLALLYLNAKDDHVASVREMSRSCAIPVTLLSKIMQSMKGAGFVQAVHGNQGGYRLAKDLTEINLKELSETLSGPIQVAQCLEPGNEECPARTNCAIITPMTVLNKKIIGLFQATSVDSLVNAKGEV